MALQESQLSALRRALSPGQLVTSAVELVTYEVDGGMDRGRPDGAAFPQSAEDVLRIVGWARQHGVPLVARGAGTGLSGGAVPERGGLVVEFSRMRRVVEVDEAGRSAVVQPGVVTQLLDAQLKKVGLYYPPDPASGRSSSIGGNIAENSGGPHCFKYGVTSNYVTGMRAVLADGRLVRLGGRALDVPEYDLVGLVTGSEGTLALVVEADVRLVRNPPALKTMMAAFDSVEVAGAAVSAIIARGLTPATIEMMDQRMMRILEDYAHADLPVDAAAALIIEADGYAESVGPQIDEIAEIVRGFTDRPPRIAQTAAERDRIWYARKSAAGAIARLAPLYYMVDVTVPRSQLAAMLAGCNQICAQHELRVGYVLHAGDGNLHPLILIEDPSDAALVARAHTAGREMVELCISFDGSITGEHGVGIEKREYMPLMHAPAELDVMRELRAAFDPAEALNPGKIFPRAAAEPAPAQPAPAIQEGPAPAGVFAPASAEEAAEAIRACLAEGRGVRIRGGGTKSGRLPACDATLSTAAMAGVRSYARDDLTVTVGAGTPLAELQAELARDGMWVAAASPYPGATVGGVVASAASSPLRLRYGAPRDLVLAARVALPDGRVIRAGRPVMKNVAGYDLPKLFVGSHGTLGLLAEVTLRLHPLPRSRATLFAPAETLARAAEVASRLLRVGFVASAVLVCRGVPTPAGPAPFAVVYTAEGLREDVAAELAEARAALRGLGAQGVVLDGPSGAELWSGWLGGVALGEGPEALVRLGVPPRSLPELLARVEPSLGGAPFVADVAGGQLYARGVHDVAAARALAQAAGGYAVVIAATPGVPGADETWGWPAESADLMRAIKRRWDPRGLLNPGAFVV